MTTAAANNQEMTAITGTQSEITTDPYSLGGDDRATVMFNVHYVWALGGGTTTVAWKAQVSNDGVYWVDAGGTMSDSARAATGSTPQKKTGAVNGEFVRFVITLDNAGGTLGGANFDLHVKFDHT